VSICSSSFSYKMVSSAKEVSQGSHFRRIIVSQEESVCSEKISYITCIYRNAKRLQYQQSKTIYLTLLKRSEKWRLIERVVYAPSHGLVVADDYYCEMFQI
jgi:hypothetical protein